MGCDMDSKNGGRKFWMRSTIQPTISLEMTLPSQGHYGFHSFPVVDWFFCLYTYEFWLSLWKIVRSSVILLLPLFSFSQNIMSFFWGNFFPWSSRFPLSDQFSLLIYLCLLPSSATFKMDNRENMENVHYAINDDTAGFKYQRKNRNTSGITEYDLNSMNNYFASIYT